ncbi:MAG: RNA polymerase sigma factor [bacterium]|nr:RNA polymerase sigma factor [bacterium]
MNSDKQKTESKGSEKKIFALLKSKKDKDAFIEAYDLYVDQIYRFVYFKVSDKDDAHDLTSAVFLKVWNYIQENKIKDFKTLKALIYTIARTTIIDHYRKNKNRNISLDIEQELDIEDKNQNIEKSAIISSDFEIVKKKLYELKDEYREIIVLRFIDELSVSEISKIVNKSNGNIRVLIHRALKALQDLTKDN